MNRPVGNASKSLNEEIVARTSGANSGAALQGELRHGELRHGDAAQRDTAGDLQRMQRLQAGDRDAFRQLFDTYHHRAFAVALAVVKNPQDAHDVVQETFLRVYHRASTFVGGSSFFTWMYRILMNVAIDHHRRMGRAVLVALEAEPGHEGASLPPSATLPLVAPAADPLRRAEEQQLGVAVEMALQQLSLEHRTVVLLREVEGLSYEEIAEVLQIPKGTVMSRLFHARKKLQETLGEYLLRDGE